jgi:hypothetical protein
MDLYRMLESDLEHVDEEDRRAIAEALYAALQRPLISVFRDASPAAAAPQPPSPELLAGSFLASIQAVHHLRADFRIPVSKEHMAGQVCDVLAAGVNAIAGGCT